MINVYCIKSIKKQYRYVGITNNLERRVRQHNYGHNIATKYYAPFEIILKEQYANYKEARKREKFLKSGIGRKFLDNLKKIK